jgi:hypothetical protein
VTQASDISTGFLIVEDGYSIELQIHKCSDESNGTYYRFKLIIEYEVSVPHWDIATNGIIYINSNEYWLQFARKTHSDAMKLATKLAKEIVANRIEGL